MENDPLTGKILDCAFRVHSALGPGLLESAYQECLYYELRKNGLFVEKQKGMPLYYDEVEMDVGYRIDILVERKVVVEIKSVSELLPIHRAQGLAYLNLSGCKRGLLLNFNTKYLKDGIVRLAN